LKWTALLLAAAFLILAGCGDAGDSTVSRSGNTEASIKVITTTTVIAALAEEVAGEHGQVASILPPGTDPHTFEPSPDQAGAVAEADVILANGIGLDDYLTDFVRAANPDVPINVVTEGVELLGSGEEHADHEVEGAAEGDHGSFDPHVWQDPLRVQQMVTNIAEALAAADPAHAEDYQRNAAAYNAQLDELDAEIRAMFGPVPAANRKIVTNHESLAYFADRYELELVGTVIPGAYADREPSAHDIAELVELIESSGVRAIFAEQLIDPKIAEQIANDTGIEIVSGTYTDGVGAPGSGAETVDGMLRTNAETISDALSN
jgi:ABC-type Zn uptake system ZnuABC Zn-binding protein ZnuA